jgi:SAM domain (Sterile alpha motif)
MDLGEWLRSLGLERYEPAFRENDIDDAILPGFGRGSEGAWR